MEDLKTLIADGFEDVLVGNRELNEKQRAEIGSRVCEIIEAAGYAIVYKEWVYRVRSGTHIGSEEVSPEAARAAFSDQLAGAVQFGRGDVDHVGWLQRKLDIAWENVREAGEDG